MELAGEVDAVGFAAHRLDDSGKGIAEEVDLGAIRVKRLALENTAKKIGPPCVTMCHSAGVFHGESAWKSGGLRSPQAIFICHPGQCPLNVRSG